MDRNIVLAVFLLSAAEEYCVQFVFFLLASLNFSEENMGPLSSKWLSSVFLDS